MKKSLIIIVLLLSGFIVSPFYIHPQEGINRIESLNITETDTDTFITITAIDKINYTIFKMDDPPRITLDFGNADLSELKKSYSVENGIIKNIKVITEVEGGLPISRMEINLEKLMDFSSTQEDNRLLITVSKTTEYKPPEVPAEAPPEEPGIEALTAPAEGELPPEAGEIEGLEAAIPEEELPEEGGIPVETAELPGPPVSGGIEAPVAVPPAEGVAPPEEAAGEIPLAGEEIAIEEEGASAEGELPVAEETPPEELAVAGVPEEAEGTKEMKTIEEVIEKSEAPAVVAPPPEEKPPVVAQAPPPLMETAPPPPVPVKKEKKAWIKGNKIVTAEKLRFNPNEAVLPSEYEPIVKEIARILIENPRIKIRIEGHTDNAGNKEFNRALSEYRAIWIKLLLEKYGVAGERIQIAGFGESNPIASNDTEKGREKNRRVEFIIIQK